MANLLAVSEIFHWGAAAKITLLVAASVTLLIAVVVLIISVCEHKKETAAKIYVQQAQEERAPAAEPEQAPEPLPVEEPLPAEEPILAPVQEVAAAEEAPDLPEEIELTEEATLVDDAENADVGTVIAGGWRIRVRYDRSFTAKLIQSDDELKARYSELKNELLSYGLKDRMSWTCETYRYKRVAYAKFAIRGKTLSLYLALDPEEFKESKYFYEDASSVNKYAAVPLRLKIKSDRGVKWAKELIAIMAEKIGLEKAEREAEDFTLPYEYTEALVRRKLIKLERVKDVDFSTFERSAPAPVQGLAPEPEAVAEPVPEPDVQAVAEPEPVEEPAPEPEEQAGGEILLTEDAQLIDDAEDGDAGTVIANGLRIRVRYDRSFTARLSQADDVIKARYMELKAELLSYGVKARMSWPCETYRYKRVAYAKFAIRGKTLSIYLALDPAELAGTKYFFEDASGITKYRNVPVRMKLKSNRSVKWAKELIALMMERAGLTRGEAVAVDCPEYRATETLVNERLIRLYEDKSARFTFIEKNIEPAAAPEAERPLEEVAEQAEATEEAEEQPAEQAEETEQLAETIEEPAEAEIAAAEDEILAEVGNEPAAEDETVAPMEAQPEEETEAAETLVAPIAEAPEEESEKALPAEEVREEVTAAQASALMTAEETEPAEEVAEQAEATEETEEQPAEQAEETEQLAETIEEPAEAEIAAAEDETVAEVGNEPAAEDETVAPMEAQPEEETEAAETLVAPIAEAPEEEPEKALPAEEVREEVTAAQASALMTDEEAESVEEVAEQAEATEETEEQPAEQAEATEETEEQPAEQTEEAEQLAETIEEPAEAEIAAAEDETVAEVGNEPAAEDETVAPMEAQPEEETEAAETLVAPIAEAPEEEPEKALPAEEVREEVTAAQASALMTDEEAEEYLIEKSAEGEGTAGPSFAKPSSGKAPSARSEKSGKAVKAIVNISTLSAQFEGGDKVDLAALKHKKIVARKTTYVKILANGRLNKPLTVEANDFSMEAVKMIVLTGGKAIRINR